MNSGPQGVFAALMRFLKAPELLNFILEDPLSKKRAEAYESEVNSYIRRFGTGSGDLTMPVGAIQTMTIACQRLEGIWEKLPEGGERDKWIDVYLDYALLFKDMLETRDFPLDLSNRFLDACREGVDFRAVQKDITSVGTLNFNLSENRSVARGIYADVGRARLSRNAPRLSTPSSFAADHLHDSGSSRNKPNQEKVFPKVCTQSQVQYTCGCAKDGLFVECEMHDKEDDIRCSSIDYVRQSESTNKCRGCTGTARFC